MKSVQQRQGRGTVGDPVVRLASFFPLATPVRLPVYVSCVGQPGATERAVIEYGTAREVLFGSNLPLEIGSRVLLENADGTLRAEAAVVAVQVDGGKTAVAARFATPITNWIIQP